MPAEFDIVAAENRRLAREVKELRSRVSAYEASRWLRLHPRLLLHRLRTLLPMREAARDETLPEPVENGRTLSRDDALTERFFDDVVARGSFRDDMISVSFATWEPFLKEL